MQRLTHALKMLSLGDVAVRRNPLFYSEARRTLRMLDGAGLEWVREWTRDRLQRVLASARRSRYGKRVGAAQHIETWPLLDKSAVREDPESFCTYPALLAVRSSTGGTTGMPLKLFRSLRSIAFEQACLDLMVEKLGADARSARCAVLRTETIKDPDDTQPPYWVAAAAGRRLVFSSPHLNASTLHHYVDALEAFSPEVLMTYPSSLEMLCLLLESAGKRLAIPRVMCSSEMLHPHVWQLAQERLRCRVLDYYGQAERVAFASATAPGAYRFQPGYAYVEFQEIAREDDERVLEIVGTPLWNGSMALVRYRTGDLIRVSSTWSEQDLAALAFGQRTFSGVFGRSGDTLITPEGGRVTGISHFQRDVEHILRIQVIQESPSEVQVLVLAEPSFDVRDRERLMSNVRTKLPSTMRVEFRCAERLERTAQGKTPFVIHRPAVKKLLQPHAH